jgi:putative SOS response-associated peptidase YedK
VSWKLSRTVLRGGSASNGGSPLDHLNADGSKQPFFIHASDQPVFGFAGLWDTSTRADGTAVESCTIITMPANALIADIHNAPGKQRMPALLHASDHEAWLAGTASAAQEVLRRYPADCMVAWPVSTRVNSPRQDDASLIEPL